MRFKSLKYFPAKKEQPEKTTILSPVHTPSECHCMSLVSALWRCLWAFLLLSL